jgi:group I intron endonuclease
MEEIKYTIYKLIDPLTNEIRYIGLTFNDLKQRLRSHCSEKSRSHKSNWIRKIISQGHRPIIEVVEEDISSYDECCEKEIYYIEKYLSGGHPLTNMATGGNKNKKMSEETRRKMSDSQKRRNETHKRVLSEETKKLLSKKAKEKFEREEEREKLRIANKRFEESKTIEQKLQDILIQDCKKVFQYDKEMNLIREYPSVRNAAKETDIHRSNIMKSANKKCPTAGGFVWRYEGDLTPPTYKYKKVSDI